MRKAFIGALTEAASADPAIYLLAGDVGFSIIEPFAQTFGHRYFNAGVAEQNMVGVAAGLAMAGKKPIVYSIIPFVTMRCYEQVRLDVCYQELPVLVVGTGAGYGYGPMGASHHAHEDMAIMAAIPGMTVVAPACTQEVSALLPQLLAQGKPAYMRLTVAPVADYPSEASIVLNKATVLQPLDGVDCVLIATGGAVVHALQVAQTLQTVGIRCGVASMHTVKPLDVDFVMQAAGTCRLLVTMEDHALRGGLGQQVAHELTQHDVQNSLLTFGFADSFMHHAGSRSDLEKLAGLDVEQMTKLILNSLKDMK